jgi:hypothetical protein
MVIELVWRFGGMILIGETEVFGEKPVPLPVLFTTNSTWTSLGSSPGLRGEKSANKHLSHCTAAMEFAANK